MFPIFQHAYFVNDIVEAAHKWHELYGAGPFVHVPHHVTDKFQYRGTKQEADVSYGFGYLGDNQIQFIQQHDDTPSIYRDMYDILGREDIDAVLITTGDRWHTLASILAAKAGKDIYCEKPCSMTIEESRMLADGIARYGRVYQAGTQRRSMADTQRHS